MPAPATERRILTVVFSDLSGFTSLSEHMDPEDVTDIIDGLFRRLRATIEGFGGTVDKFIGDAVMAVFGAPVTHEDDPLRAVRAGLAMQREVAAFNVERKLDLALRIGINTGEALWGSVAGDRPTAMGEAVNVAQRMEASARPGAVLVTRSVERATFRRIKYADLNPVSPKGRGEPIPAFEAASERPESAEGPAVGFFGRDAELARLFELHAAGKGAFVVIEGDAGIGKSSLAAEFLGRLRGTVPPPFMASGRAPEGGCLPLAGLADLIRSAAAGTPVPAWLEAGLPAKLPAGERAARGRLLARSLGIEAGETPGAELDPVRLADETRVGWAEFLRARGPSVLCFDDMENADPGLLELLGHLATRLQDAPITLLLTARRGFVLPGGFQRMELGPLGPGELAALATAAVGRPLTDGTVAFLMERTGGSPFYAAQLARWLQDEGLLEGTPARISKRPDRLPDGLQALLIARLDALDPAARDCMKTASVFGKSFWGGVLAAVAGRDTAADVASASRAEIVEARDLSMLPGDREYAFRQSLIQEAAYSLLTKRDRARLHGAAATALEALGPAAGRRKTPFAARQRELEGRLDEAARLWLEAAREAKAAGAWDEAMVAAGEAGRLGAGPEAAAIELHVIATTAIRTDAPELLARVLDDPASPPLLKASALFDFANWTQRVRGAIEFHEAAQRAAEASPGMGQAGAVARLLLLGAEANRGRLEEVLERAEKLLAEPFAIESPLHRARILQQRAQIFQRKGEYAAAEKDYEEIVSFHRAEGQALYLSVALRGRALLYRNMGRYPEAIASIDEAVGIFRESSDRAGLAQFLVQRATILRVAGRPAEARSTIEEAAVLARHMGLQPVLASTLLALGNILGDQGNHAGAEVAWEESANLLRVLGDRSSLSVAMSNISISRQLAGDAESARKLLLEAAEIQRDFGGKRLLARNLEAAGALDLLLGDPAAARQRLEEALAISEQLNLTEEIGSVLVLLAEAFTKMGQPESANSRLADGLARVRALKVPGNRTDSLVRAASLFVAKGDGAGAEALLREAIECAAVVPIRAFEARLLLSRQLEARGEVAEARALVAVARDLALGSGVARLRALAAARAAVLAARDGDAATAASLAEQARAETAQFLPGERELFEADLRHSLGQRHG